MRLERPRPLPIAAPAEALANVTMLLVLFFLLATGIGGDRSGVSLPTAQPLFEAPPGSASVIVERRVDPDAGETLSWRFSDGRGDDRRIPGPGALFFEVSRIVADDPDRVFLLRIDADVRYAVVDEVLDWLAKAGAR